jgi:hypothetical protein
VQRREGQLKAKNILVGTEPPFRGNSYYYYLSVNGFLPGDSGNTIRHNKQHTTHKKNTTIKRNSTHNYTHNKGDATQNENNHNYKYIN